MHFARALWSLFAAILLLVVAPGCGTIADTDDTDQTRERRVTIDFRSEMKDGKEVGLPWLEPAIPTAEAKSLVAGFDWAKTTPLREWDADGSPALYYGVVYVTSRDQTAILDQVYLHHSTMPLFGRETAKWNGLRGKVPQSNDGKGAFVFAIIPGRIYNAIRQWAIAGDPLLSAIVLRDVPEEARNAEGSLSYDRLVESKFRYRGMDPIRPSNVGTTQQPFVILTVREALAAVAEAAAAIPRLVALALGNRDRDGLIFGIGAAGSVKLHLKLEVHDTDPAFGGGVMKRAWGVASGQPVQLPGVRVSVWSRGGSIVLDLPTLFEATTDASSQLTLNLAKDRPVERLCIATENYAAQITDFLTEIEVCDFKGSVDQNIDYLKTDTFATVTLSEPYFNILAQATEGRAYLEDVAGYTPHKAEIVVGWIANAMGFFGTGAPFTPCLGFPNLSADILVVDILGLIATTIPVVGVALAAVLAAATPLMAADMFFPDSDALRSRGAPTHEYGHFATCSMLYDSNPLYISTSWTNAAAERIGSGALPGPTASQAYGIEALADFFAGQVVGGTNYFKPGTITSGLMSYCDVNGVNRDDCLDHNYSDQSSFTSQVARVATTLHDAFDGALDQAFFPSKPGNGDVWTSSGGVVVWDGVARNGDGFDDQVRLPGSAINTFVGKLSSFKEDKLMTSLASTIRDNGYDWCQTCRIFSLHAGVDKSAPDADHYAACAAAPIASWVGPAPDSSVPTSCNFTRCPDPLVLSGGTCVPCAAGQVAQQGTTCRDCPPGTVVVNNQCETCSGGSCTLVCLDRQQIVNGVCVDCAANEISAGGVCQACPQGQNRFENTCVTSCPPRDGYVTIVVDGVCEYLIP
jgi:hypothetical protein